MKVRKIKNGATGTKSVVTVNLPIPISNLHCRRLVLAVIFSLILILSGTLYQERASAIIKKPTPVKVRLGCASQNGSNERGCDEAKKKIHVKIKYGCPAGESAFLDYWDDEFECS